MMKTGKENERRMERVELGLEINVRAMVEEPLGDLKTADRDSCVKSRVARSLLKVDDRSSFEKTFKDR